MASVSRSYERRAANASDYYAGQAEREIGQSCPRLSPDLQKECVAKAEAAARENQRSEQDLAAQQVTAWWTQVMGGAALIGMALSAIGVALVWTTFREQRRATDLAHAEAERARAEAKESGKLTLEALATAQRNADALVKQVDVAESTARLQLRAYLTIGKIRLKRTPEQDTGDLLSYSTRVWFSNVGATPGLNLRIRYERFIGPNENPSFAWIEGHEWNPLPPVLQKMSNHIDDPTTLERGQVGPLQKGDLFSYLLVQIEYDDVYGARYLQGAILLMDAEKCRWHLHKQSEVQIA